MEEAKEQRVRRWQRPREETVPVRAREEGARVQGGAVLSSSATVEMNAQTKKRQTVISPEQTEVRIVVPPELRHDTRICIEDLADTDIDESDIDELRDEREVQDENVDIRHGELVHRDRNRWNAQTRSSAATWVREASKSGTHVASCSDSSMTLNWNMLTSGSGRRKRRSGPTASPTLKTHAIAQRG